MNVKIKKHLTNKNVKSLIFMISNIIVMVFAFIVNVIITNYCSVDDYGKYKYATNFILTIPALCSLGINHSCGRLVAIKDINKSKGIIGISLFLIAVISIIITSLLYLGQILIPTIKSYFQSSIYIVIPFVVIFMLQTVVQAIYQGTGEIYKLSLFAVFPYLIMIIIFSFLIIINGKISFKSAIYIFLVSNTIIIIPRLICTKFKITNVKKELTELLIENKMNGFKIYLSSIFTTTSTQVIGLIAGNYAGYKEYGYYALAISLSGIFRMIASSIAVARYRDNIKKFYIDKKEILLVILLNIIVYVIFYFVINIVFFWIYPIEYKPAIFYLKISAVMNSIYGISEYFNKFFIGKGLGKVIMVISLITGIINIIMSFILIKLLSITGLVLAGLIASFINIVLYIIEYFKYCNRKNESSITLESNYE